jgi:uncharacterized protein
MGVMAKAPRPGLAKTRLCPPLHPTQAAQLSAAFLRDVTENIALAARDVPIHGCIAYAPMGAEAWFDGHVAEGTGFVLADGTPPMPGNVQGFGRCLLHAMQAMLGAGFEAACVVNSDSPTLPTALLIRAARTLLEPGERIVLGPAEDGGYYLLGMKQPHAHLFANIAWSTGEVATVTRTRAAELGLDVITLAPWYDVDDEAALRRLVAGTPLTAGSLNLQPYPASATRDCIDRIGLGEQSSIAAQ